SPKLASSGHYPAIDLLASKSRLMRELVPQKVSRNAAYLRSLMAKYLEIELLIQVGEYAPGSDPEADKAMAAKPLITALTRQMADEATAFEMAEAQLEAIVDGLEDQPGEQTAAA
ncbi:MAG: hypothetical protein AAF441_26780, partial [Pseudomonadota bacterium]